MVEGHALEAQLGALSHLRQLPPGHRRGEAPAFLQAGEVGRGAEVGDDDDALQARDLGGDVGDRLEPVEVLAAVAVAVDGEHHLGLDLGEAVHDAAGAEVGRAARPDRAQAGGGEEGDQRLGRVGEVGDDAVAAPHAQGPQALRDRGDLLAELAPADLAQLTQLGGVADGDLVGVLASEDVLGVVQLRALEPAGARHRPLGQNPLVRRRLDVEVLPDRGPEVLQFRHRPLPQLRVVAGLDPALGGEPAHVPGQRRALDRLGARLPELLGLFARHC